jgi:hypothetical protein
MSPPFSRFFSSVALAAVGIIFPVGATDAIGAEENAIPPEVFRLPPVFPDDGDAGFDRNAPVAFTIHAAPDGVDAEYDARVPAGVGCVPGKPLSIHAAVRAANKLGAETGWAGACQIILADGTYYLREPLRFSHGPDEKGRQFLLVTPGTPPGAGVTPAPTVPGAPERVVLSGGIPLKLDWKPHGGGIFRAVVPEGVKPFDQLFVNGKLRVLARYPNYDVHAQYLNGTSSDATSPRRAAGWKDPAGAFVHVLHRSFWGDMHYRVTGKSADNKLRLEGGWQNNRPEQGPHKDHRFIEGVFEELDAPDEWFYDAAGRVLYFYPPKGLDSLPALASATVVVPQLENLVTIAGTRENPARRVRIEGVSFSHALRTFMKKKEPLQRGDWCVYRGGAVLLENTEDCSVANGTFSNLGGNAVFVNNHNRRARLSGLHIHDIGANAIAFVGDPAAARSPLFHYSKSQPYERMDKEFGPKGDNYPADCLVTDTLITRCGLVEKQITGVNIDLSSRITVRHCTIARMPRAGINIGSGTWGGHRIEHCDIFDTVRETGDHGSFNSWGRDRFWYPDRNRTTNALVAKNKALPYLDAVQPVALHHNRWRCDHGWDIDLDDGSTNYVITDNLCLNGGIKLREGYGRVVENNITVNNGLHPHAWFENSGDVVRRNIFFQTYSPSNSMRVSVWGKEFDHNLHHRPGVAQPQPASELRKVARQDAHSILADAKFLNPSAGDYRVAADSPAIALGFRNFSMEGFGVRPPALRRLAPEVVLPGIPDASAGGVGGKTSAGGGASGRRDATPVTWQGGRLRNVVGLTDISAAGLSEETGVLVLQSVEKGSPLSAYDLQADDVILKWGNAVVTDVSSLLAAHKADPRPATLAIWRAQSPVLLKRK